jgi:hypothetical protein
MKKWLLNPFEYIAGAHALFIGWGVMALTAIIGYYSHTHFDGVIDIHIGRISPMQVYFLEQLADWGCLVLLLYPAALFFSNSKIRFIDIAGTLALARWVMVFPAIMSFGAKPFPAPFPKFHTPGETMKFMSTYTTTIVLGVLMIPFTVWMIALMYNAFKVSSNIKGGKATGIFIAGIFTAEIVAFLVIHQFINK